MSVLSLALCQAWVAAETKSGSELVELSACAVECVFKRQGCHSVEIVSEV